MKKLHKTSSDSSQSIFLLDESSKRELNRALKEFGGSTDYLRKTLLLTPQKHNEESLEIFGETKKKLWKLELPNNNIKYSKVALGVLSKISKEIKKAKRWHYDLKTVSDLSGDNGEIFSKVISLNLPKGNLKVDFNKVFYFLKALLIDLENENLLKKYLKTKNHTPELHLKQIKTKMVDLKEKIKLLDSEGGDNTQEKESLSQLSNKRQTLLKTLRMALKHNFDDLAVYQVANNGMPWAIQQAKSALNPKKNEKMDLSGLDSPKVSSRYILNRLRFDHESPDVPFREVGNWAVKEIFPGVDCEEGVEHLTYLWRVILVNSQRLGIEPHEFSGIVFASLRHKNLIEVLKTLQIVQGSLEEINVSVKDGIGDISKLTQVAKDIFNNFQSYTDFQRNIPNFL